MKHVTRALTMLTVLTITLTASMAVLAGDANLSWTHPTQRVDGSALALTAIRETRLEWGKCVAGTNAFPPTITGSRTVAAPAATTVVTGLDYGNWCFRAYTADTDGLLSDASATAYKLFNAPPRPPVLTAVGGIVWEMRMHPVDGPYLSRVIGTIEAGKPCLGLAPQTGFDIFQINPADAKLDRKLNPNGMAVAQCAIS